ncbi:BUD32 family EKC/KEOPS complex subunit [Halarcobacter bivalviorum]|uniref:kinase n=1 Tax=Halarcobacter bivalviorum TaxID=663364 RepID=UPI00100ACB4D|nr:kinase [Halarcobacter bivalviorum]RXK07343.1 kinase [Halarcobacter bivalviorum]
MGLDKKLEEEIFSLSKDNKEEIFSFEYATKKYWLKRARATKSNFIHKLFYQLTDIDILLPVENKSEKQSLLYETTKIERLKEKGVCTPNIIFKNEEFFVLEDSGKMVNSYIRKRDITKEKMYYYIELMLKELALIHNNKEFHGGAQARNFIYKEDKITVIDFEDSFDKSISLETLQFRDLILFLLSLTKTRASFELDYNFIINQYIQLVPQNKDFRKRLKKLASKLSFLITLSQIKFIKNIMGRDGEGFFKLLLILKNLEG